MVVVVYAEVMVLYSVSVVPKSTSVDIRTRAGAAEPTGSSENLCRYHSSTRKRGGLDDCRSLLLDRRTGDSSAGQGTVDSFDTCLLGSNILGGHGTFAESISI